MPLSVYDKYFGNSKAFIAGSAALDPLSFSTPLFILVTLAKSFGLSVEEYKKRFSRKQRYIFYIHRVMEIEKEIHSYEKAERERESKANAARHQGYR